MSDNSIDRRIKTLERLKNNLVKRHESKVLSIDKKLSELKVSLEAKPIKRSKKVADKIEELVKENVGFINL